MSSIPQGSDGRMPHSVVAVHGFGPPSGVGFRYAVSPSADGVRVVAGDHPNTWDANHDGLRIAESQVIVCDTIGKLAIYELGLLVVEYLRERAA
jgi:hypothetical protein